MNNDLEGARLTTALGWLTGLGVLLVAAGGAASRPGGWRLGMPTAAAAVAAVLGLALVARLCGARAGGAFLGLAPVLAGALLGFAFPGMAAFTGAPLFALAAAVAAGVSVEAPVGWRRKAFAPLVAVVYFTGAARVQEQVGPEGDEPHYLMVAESLLRDGDLALERDYAEGRYRPFHPEPLEPHYRVRGRHGEIYSLHAVGLSLLVLPAYAAGGYPGASLFMAALALWLAIEVRRLLASWTGERGLAEGVAWLVALSPPLVHYAGLIFTEVPAALALALALRWAQDPTSLTRAILGGVALAALPWLNVRYAVLAALVFAYVLLRRPSPRAFVAWATAPIVSALALAAYHQTLYGFLDPRRVYGRRPELSASLLPSGVPGLLLDQEFGLFVYAPVFVLAVPGLWSLVRERRREGLVLGALLVAAILLAGSWPMWRGGFNPPARFLLPVVPALAVAVAWRLKRGLSTGAALLAGWGLWVGLAGWSAPRLVHRDRDGTAPLFRTYSGAEEWTRLLPGYVLEESARDRRPLTAVWVVALSVAALAAGRATRVTPAGMALATTALVAAAGVASRMASAKTEGRDAVRLVGRPALDVPLGPLWPRAPGEWTPAALFWGPAYEPHRAPVVVGERLALRPGTYRLDLSIAAVGAPPQPPTLEVRRGAVASEVPFVATPGGLSAGFDVVPGVLPTTLRLSGGGPFILQALRLEASTFGAGGGLNTVDGGLR